MSEVLGSRSCPGLPLASYVTLGNLSNFLSFCLIMQHSSFSLCHTDNKTSRVKHMPERHRCTDLKGYKLEQWFSNINVHQSHLEKLLRLRLSGLISRVSSRSGVGPKAL